jgi:hypothetical protein
MRNRIFRKSKENYLEKLKTLIMPALINNAWKTLKAAASNSFIKTKLGHRRQMIRRERRAKRII